MEFENPPPTGNIVFDTWAQRLVEMLRTQPVFYVRPGSSQDDVPIDDWNDVNFSSELVDYGNNFESPSFTAPVDGPYFLFSTLIVYSLDIDAVYYTSRIFLSTGSPINVMDPTEFNADISHWPFCMAGMADMTAGDTAKVQFYQSSGLAQADIQTSSVFGGFLIK